MMNLAKLDINVIIKYLIILIVVAIVGTITYKKIQKAIQKGKMKQSISGLDDMIETNELNYTESEYKMMADGLYRAMNGTGTDEQAIYDILERIKSGSDAAKIILEFGVRESTVWLSGFAGNLGDWLRNEMNESELDRVMKYFETYGLNI